MIFKRREFVKLGGIAAAGTIIIPQLTESCMGNTLNDDTISYLDHFGVSAYQLQKVISTAMGKGADYADLFFEHTIHNTAMLQDNKVNRAYSDIKYGVGIRVLKDEQTGFAYSEDTSVESMIRAAKTAANIANGSASDIKMKLSELKPPSFYNIKSPWEQVSIKDKVPFISSLNDKIFSGDRRVSKVIVTMDDITSYILFFNSEGLISHDYRPLTYLSARTIMEENGRIENSTVAQSYRLGYEFLSEDLTDTLARQAVEETSILFKAVKPKAGEMEVVMGGGRSGILLHEAMGHSFEADFNRKKTSIFSDKMGKKIEIGRAHV